MNPLTRKAVYNVNNERRQDTLISIACGLVFAVLTIAFFL